MLRSNSKSLGNHIVSPEEEKERLQWEGFAEKKGFNSGIIGVNSYYAQGLKPPTFMIMGLAYMTSPPLL